MKVLQVTNHFHPCIGGVETFVKNLAINLGQRGIQCEVLCLDKCPKEQKKLPSIDNLGPIKINRTSFFDFKYYLPVFSFTKLLGLAKNADVLHVHSLGFFSDFFLATKPLHKKPVIVSTHGGIWHTEKIMPLKKLYVDFFQRFFTLTNADLIIADSNNDFDLFSKKFPKTVLIENAVNISRFLKAKRDDFGENFIFLGRLSKNKNIEALINSFEIVYKKHPNAILFIVGKNFDQDLQNLEKLVKEKKLEKNILFTGELKEQELLETVKKCNYCVYSSTFEGFGISVLELMGAGIIPILNRIPTFTSFVDDGENGFITSFEEPLTAANSILNVLELTENEKKRLSSNAIKKANTFSWEKKTTTYTEAYKGVTEAK